MWQRITSIVIKEFIQLSRDRRSMAMVLFLPLFQMCIFGYAVSSDIKNVSTVVWDASNTAESRELIESFRQTEFFSVNYYAIDYDDIAKRIESGDAKVALVIPPEYSRHLHRGEIAQVQLFADGSDPSTGLQALANASLIVQAKGAELMSKSQLKEIVLPILLQPRIWYNPAMQSSIFYLPGLVGVILQNLTILLTAFAVVREKENGTIEQLNVTPLRRGELIVAKLIPYILIAYIQVMMILVPAILIFDMPVRGSLPLLLSLASLFIMFSLAIGLLISTVSHNQFQAMQSAFLMLIPSIMLSGFIWPLETMPKLAQWISTVIPLTYFLRILRGIVVKGVGFELLWQEAAILAVMGVATLVLAATRVRRTLA
ncbi:ABC transporter permease [Chloroflexota bacterium]